MISHEMPGKEGGERELKVPTRQELENDLRSLEELLNLREKRLDEMRRQLDSQDLSEEKKRAIEEDLVKLMTLQEKQQGNMIALREQIRRMKEKEEKEN